jgi:hypothetical protein
MNTYAAATNLMRLPFQKLPQSSSAACSKAPHGIAQGHAKPARLPQPYHFPTVFLAKATMFY